MTDRSDDRAPSTSRGLRMGMGSLTLAGAVFFGVVTPQDVTHEVIPDASSQAAEDDPGPEAA